MATTSPAPTPAHGAVERLGAAGRVFESLFAEVAGLDDVDLVRVAQRVAAAARMVSAVRTRVAGEIEARSKRPDAAELSAGSTPLNPADRSVDINDDGGRLDVAETLLLQGEERSERTAARPTASRLGGRLSSAFGCRNGVELIQRAMGASGREASGWAKLDRLTQARTTPSGQFRPAEFPVLGGALARGAVSDEAARLLTSRLGKVAARGGVSPLEWEKAERALVPAAAQPTVHDLLPGEVSPAAVPGLAVEFPDDAGGAGGDEPGGVEADHERARAYPRAWSFEGLSSMVDAWEAFLTRDGFADDAADAVRRRGVNLGRERDGLVRIWGELVPETATGLIRLIDAHKGSRVAFGQLPDRKPDGQAWGEGDGDVVPDDRTPSQVRHDILTSIISTAARAADAPTIGGAAPTLVVTIDADQLGTGGCGTGQSGAGHPGTGRSAIDQSVSGTCRIDGADGLSPASVAHRIACTGAVQKILTDKTGRILSLGSPERLFTPHQRRAIAVRDGGCVIPGCDVPPSWCEVHHVEEHSRGGPTHTDNGVLLCWHHHHNLEASGWGIEMRRGVPWVAPPGWIDPRRRSRPVLNPKRYRPERA